MSSILDALSKVDQADPDRAPTFQLPLPPPQRRPRRWRVFVPLASIVGVGLWYFQPVTAPPPPEAPPATVTPATLAPPMVAQPSAPPSSGLPVVAAIAPPTPVPGEQPWVRTAAPTPPPAPVEAAPPEPLPPPATLPPEPARVAPATPPPPPRGIFIAPKPEAEVEPPTARLPEPPPGTEELSGVQISFLAYSRVPTLRTVSLALEGGGLLTLREGERSGDLQVTRIYPDRVDLVRAGAPFTVRARP